MTEDQPWYALWFDEAYRRVYRRRDLRAAEREVAFAIEALELHRDMRIHDLCAGDGRHLYHLLNRGFQRAFGSDLSPSQLAIARERCLQVAGFVPLVRADMRYTIATGLDAVLSFFTSYGYFEDDTENEQVLQAIHDSLVADGRFLLDVANKTETLATLQPRTVRLVDRFPVVEERWYDTASQRLHKRITMHDPAHPLVRIESVRLYDRDELVAQLQRAGLVVDKTYGDFSGKPWSPTTERTILVGHRPPRPAAYS